MENLSLDACWARLAATPVGRLAVMVRGDPEIFPLNFVVDGRSIVFRTDEGSKVLGLRRDSVVCFEIDDIDVDGQSGWSVIVKGIGRARCSTPTSDDASSSCRSRPGPSVRRPTTSASRPQR